MLLTNALWATEYESLPYVRVTDKIVVKFFRSDFQIDKAESGKYASPEWLLELYMRVKDNRAKKYIRCGFQIIDLAE